MITFSKKIKDLRKELGITQQNLANAINVSIGTIGQYETDKCQPSHEVLVKLADYFNVTLDELYGREE